QSGSVSVPEDLFCPAVPYFTGDTYDRLQNLDTTQTFSGAINGFTPAPGTDTASSSITLIRGTGVDAVTVLTLNLLPGDTAFEIPAGLLEPDAFHSIGVSYVNSATSPNAGFGTATSSADYIRGTGAYFYTRPIGPTLVGTGANIF